MRIADEYLEYYNSNVMEEADWTPPARNRLKFVQVFVNADMRLWQKGLHKLASQYDINLDLLENGQFVVFINHARTKMKLYGPHNIIAYLNNGNQRLQFEHLDAIKDVFRSSANYEYADPLRDELYAILSEPIVEVRKEEEEPEEKPATPAKRRTQR